MVLMRSMTKQKKNNMNFNSYPQRLGTSASSSNPNAHSGRIFLPQQRTKKNSIKSFWKTIKKDSWPWNKRSPTMKGRYKLSLTPRRFQRPAPAFWAGPSRRWHFLRAFQEHAPAPNIALHNFSGILHSPLRADTKERDTTELIFGQVLERRCLPPNRGSFGMSETPTSCAAGSHTENGF